MKMKVNAMHRNDHYVLCVLHVNVYENRNGIEERGKNITNYCLTNSRQIVSAVVLYVQCSSCGIFYLNS